MEHQDALSIGFQVCDESPNLVKLLVIGIRTNGSVLILETGLTEEDANQMYRDFRLWVGDQLGKEISG